MDKVLVNNQIVLMRKYVKQAKTHIINKYVKQVKSLEVKKGNDSQITKNKRKIERLLEKVKILKKMKVDFVSKSALSKSKDWKSLIEQKNASLQDLCLALLANYSSVQKEVEKFHSIHSILADKIPSLIIEWETKFQNSNKKPKKGAIKNKFSMKEESFPGNLKVMKKINVDSEAKDKTKTEEKIEISALELKNNLSTSTEDKGKSTETNSPEELFADLETPSESIKKGFNFISSNKSAKLLNERDQFKTKQPKVLTEFHNLTNLQKDNIVKNKLSVRDMKIDGDYQTNLDQLDVKTDSLSVEAQSNPNCQSSIFQKLAAIANSNFELPKPKQKVFSNTNYQQTKSITFLDLNKIKDLNEIPVENASIPNDETEYSAKPKKDSFFITSDGNSDTDSEKGNSNDRNNNFNRQDMNRRGSFSKRTFPHTNEIFSRRKDFGKLPNQYKNNSLSDNRKFARSKSHKTNKSVFKHETSRRNNIQSHQNTSKESTLKKNQLKHPTLLKEKSSEPLHPSWKAKRKLKECAKTSFKGKRTVFDE